MNRLTDRTRANNAATSDNWERSADHRRHVTAMITRGFTGGAARVCLLGAGNCNDVDLAALVATFAEVHLVDIDAGAMSAGVERQGLGGESKIVPHGGVDLTGVWDELAAWSSDTPATHEQVDAMIGRMRDWPGPDIGGPFDMVVSLSLLSQLIAAAVEALGERHPRLADLVVAVRARHLRLLFDLTRPGGYGLLVTDVFASDTAPMLPQIDDKLVPALVKHMSDHGNHFHGLQPAAIVRAILTELDAEHTMPHRQLVEPWRWTLGERCYAMLGFKYQRAGESA
ncbi:MAG: hypothetical protein GC159_09270 [Phycisphaera sp.]|nr:hypothetical protein [Phycisphaera sp.]